jgi:hypothetical protein
MTEQNTSHFDLLVEHYLGLETMEMTELLLEVCGATLDKRALSFLRSRLDEEQAQMAAFQARGYIRMREKSEQLVASLKLLIAVLEQESANMEKNKS